MPLVSGGGSGVGLSQWQFYYNGLTIGQGTPFHILSVDGLRGLPAMRNQDFPRSRMDGSYPALQLMDERTVTMQLLVTRGVVGFDPYSSAPPVDHMNTAEDNLHLLEFILTPTFFPGNTFSSPEGIPKLAFYLDNSWTDNRCLFARVSSTQFLMDPAAALGYFPVTVEFLAADPRIYEDRSPIDPNTNSKGAQILQGGAFSPNNSGNTNTYPIVTLAGPFTDAEVVWTWPGASSSVQMTFHVVGGLGGGSSLIIDTLNHTITGGVSGDDSSQWLVPGQDWLYIPPSASRQNLIDWGGPHNMSVNIAGCSGTCEFRSAWSFF